MKKVGIEPPDDFEARVMDKVALIENQKGKEAGRGSYGCNCDLLSIILLLTSWLI